MGHPYAANTADLTRSSVLPSSNGEMLHSHDHASAVSWAAILAGAAAAAALSLILLMLGVGLGLSSVSPWARDGISAAALGASSIGWITFTQLVASGMGGYLAGRLRTRWLAVHGDEVHFRDTAHGFLAWAIASLATAALLTSTISSVVGSGVQAAAPAVGAAAATGAAGSALVVAKPGADDAQMGYFVDSLFRRDINNAANANANANASAGVVSSGGTASPGTVVAPAAAAEVGPAAPAATSVAEAGRIFVTSLAQPALAPDDTRYLGQLVAQRTGLSQPDAEKRVTDTYTRLQGKLQEAKTAALQTADQARKAAAKGSLWLFISLLAGAFVASLAATWGGRHRDL